MSRPKPKVLLSYTDPKTYQTEQILSVKTFYVVFYDGEPINLKSINSVINFGAPKYRRTMFPENPGHAFNLADKLNKIFKTDKFQVYAFTNQGQPISRNSNPASDSPTDLG